ncbi:hypothetical protein [Endozoicomonas sp. 8E]|uniref:hypothetical protein n=1 Tax=Endozoicomonas sp. 8E TaxID=3035692 RepID=UPI0029390C55|nr:hypothetical protein [Endozoicomonas sp. 8E]WOG28600.1 hypothetical protein P6910_02785 [Endozoicomonas sp. 8E]
MSAQHLQPETQRLNEVVSLYNYQTKKKAQASEQRIAQQFRETDRITMLLINNEPLVIKGVEYTMGDVLTQLRSDVDNREELDTRLLALLHAEQDQEEQCLSRLNRLLIADARDMLFCIQPTLLIDQHRCSTCMWHCSLPFLHGY